MLPVALNLQHNASSVFVVLDRFVRVPSAVPRRERTAHLLAQTSHPGPVGNVEGSQVERVLLRRVDRNFAAALLALLVRFGFGDVAFRALVSFICVAQSIHVQYICHEMSFDLVKARRKELCILIITSACH